MAQVPIWRRYLRFFGNDVRADVNDELGFHLDTKIRELTEQGMAPDQARAEAIRRFGDFAEVSALCRQIGEEHSRKLDWKNRAAAWWYDVRQAARGLRMTPWFACAVIVTLAAGIAGTSSLFSVVEAWIIRSVRFPEPQRIVFATSFDTKKGIENTVSFPDYKDLAARTRTMESLSAWSSDFFTISLSGPPERVMGARVSPNLFRTLAIKPALGRGFLESEAELGRNRVAVVSYGFWKTRLNGDLAAIGAPLNLNGERYLLVGVLPERFQFTLVGRSNIWVPLAATAEEASHRRERFLQLTGRLNAGVTVATAREELKTIASSLAVEYPDSNANMSVFCISLKEEIGRHVGDSFVLIVFAVTVGLLLICCSNVANLLLVRALGHKRRAAIRISLGASRARLIRQALIETLMLFLTAAVAGTLAGAWLTSAVTGFIPYENRGYLPDYGEASLNLTVLAFVLGICFLTGLIFGLGPALESSDANLVMLLKDSGTAVTHSRKAIRLRFALVAGQVVMATVLLSSTAVLVRYLHTFVSAPLGFDSTGVLTARVSLDQRQYEDPAHVRGFFESLAEANGQSAISSSVPFGPDSGTTSFRLAGLDSVNEDARNLPRARFSAVSPEFFSILKTPLIAGRAFDRSNAPDRHLAAIVNDSFAKQYFPGVDPIGRVMQLGRMDKRDATIVGVVTEIRETNDAQKNYPQIYVPFAQAPTADAFLIVRTPSDPLALLPTLRQQAAKLDPLQPIYDAKTLEERVSEAFAPYRIMSGLLVGFGFLALVLAAIGVYGVVTFSVSQRKHEIGIRAALGANRLSLHLLCLREGFWILAVGLLPGLIAGFAAGLELRALFDGIVPSSLILPLLMTAALLGAVVLIATMLPARKAASVDPLAALRSE